MADMAPERPLVPKRPRSPESGDAWKRAISPKVERSHVASSSPVWPPYPEPLAPEDLALKRNKESDVETSSFEFDSHCSIDEFDVIVNEPPGELEKLLEPIESALPYDFRILVPTMSRLRALVPSKDHVEIVSQEDTKIFHGALINVAKAFVGLSELSPYLKATYKDRYNRAKELKRTTAELENAESNLRKKRKAVRRLQLRIRELKERHVVELEKRATRAVETFKESAEYAKILEDEHQQGVEECRYHIEQRRPEWDLSFLDIPY